MSVNCPFNEYIHFGVWLNKEEYPFAKIPEKAHEYDAGYDLFSVDDLILKAGERKVVHTGVHLSFYKGWEAQIRPRSGNAAKHGITITNSPATIDSSYTGEIMVILQNTSNVDFEIKHGDKIAQLVFKRCPIISLDLMDHKPESDERGDKGFGSSGR